LAHGKVDYVAPSTEVDILVLESRVLVAGLLESVIRHHLEKSHDCLLVALDCPSSLPSVSVISNQGVIAFSLATSGL
jgi:hypothetical protein